MTTKTGTLGYIDHVSSIRKKLKAFEIGSFVATGQVPIEIGPLMEKTRELEEGLKKFIEVYGIYE